LLAEALRNPAHANVTCARLITFGMIPNSG
jgi:hypothetical protein